MHKLLQSLLLCGTVALVPIVAQAADKKSDISVSALGVDVDVDLGGKNGLKTDVDASIGGKKGLDADVDVSLGGKNGIDANVNAGLGDDVNVDIGLGTDDGKPTATTSNNDNNNSNGTDPDGDGTLTTAQRQAFNGLSPDERKALLKRCGSIGGGYDPSLVQLCKLLRMSASR